MPIHAKRIHIFVANYSNIPYYGESERYFYVRAWEYLDFISVAWKRTKNYKKSAKVDYLLLERCQFLLKQNDGFQQHLKESLFRITTLPYRLRFAALFTVLILCNFLIK